MRISTRSSAGLALLALFSTPLQAHAQGQIYFNNRVPGWIDAPVLRPDGTGAGAGVTAQVIHVKEDGSLDALEPITRFRTDSPESAYYVFGVTLVVPGVPAPV